jgi:Methyltransferase domain
LLEAVAKSMAFTDQSYYESPTSLGSRNRSKRFRQFLLPLLKEVRAARGRLRILDIGGTSQYWRPYEAELHTLDATITLLNLERMEGPRDENFVHGSATDVPFADGAFDLVHSNSTIEHVGPWSQMLKAASEIRRLANVYYVQTPNFWFPVEPHFRAPFFHFLPEQLRARLLMRVHLGFAETRSATMSAAMLRVQDARLLDRRQYAALFPDAEILDERFFGLTKSLIAIRSEGSNLIR